MARFGGENRFEQLVDSFYEGLYRYAFRLSGQSADAEDLVQETFLKAVKQLERLRDPDRVKPWLYQILRNAYLHKLRAVKQAGDVAAIPLDDIAAPEVDAAPLSGAIDRETLQRALGRLPEAFRTPIILYYFEDFSYRDIAEQMDVPIGTVMSRLARGRDVLRQRLASPADDPD